MYSCGVVFFHCGRPVSYLVTRLIEVLSDNLGFILFLSSFAEQIIRGVDPPPTVTPCEGVLCPPNQERMCLEWDLANWVVRNKVRFCVCVCLCGGRIGGHSSVP